MFTTIATIQSIASKTKPAGIISNYWFSFNSTQVSGTTVTCDTKPTATMTLSNTLAFSTTGYKEGNGCFYGGNNSYSGITTNFPSIVPSVTGFTLMCWMKCNTSMNLYTTISTNAFIFSIGCSSSTADRYGLAYSTSSSGGPGNLTFEMSGSPMPVSVSKNTADGAWHHVAINASSSTANIYIDGSNVYNTGMAGITSNTYNLCTINARCDIPTTCGLFSIDSFRIFPSVQTAAQVLSYYNAGN